MSLSGFVGFYTYLRVLSVPLIISIPAVFRYAFLYLILTVPRLLAPQTDKIKIQNARVTRKPPLGSTILVAHSSSVGQSVRTVVWVDVALYPRLLIKRWYVKGHGESFAIKHTPPNFTHSFRYPKRSTFVGTSGKLNDLYVHLFDEHVSVVCLYIYKFCSFLSNNKTHFITVIKSIWWPNSPPSLIYTNTRGIPC